MSKDSQQQQVILEYLKRTNRPYSANDVFMNLKGEIGKTHVTKAMTQLAADEVITCKTYGKQQVYCARQDELDCPTAEALKTLDAEIEQVKSEVQQTRDQVRELQQRYQMLTSALTNEQIVERLAELKEKNEKSETKLKQLRSGTELIDPEERRKLQENYDNGIRVWKQRKRMFKEVIGAITETATFSPRQLMDELGLEDDEQAGQLMDSLTLTGSA